MCGIVGYVGSGRACPILIEGLKRLEYRGYDSAGIAIQNGSGLHVVKAAGKIRELEELLAQRRTRSGTRHRPHPLGDARRAERRQRPPAHRLRGRHRGGPQRHHRELLRRSRRRSQKEGHVFRRHRHRGARAPDREVPAARAKLEQAVGAALRSVEGTYGIAVMSRRRARQDGRRAQAAARWCVGIADGEYFLASDVSPIIEHTRQVVYLDDGEMAVLSPGRIPHRDDRERARRQGDPRGRLGSRADREGRLRPLHAEGDLRAARVGPQRDARPAASWTRDWRRLGGLNMTPERAARDPPRHHPRLRHVLARGADRRVHDRGARAHPGRGGVRLRVPLPQSDRRRGHGRCW